MRLSAKGAVKTTVSDVPDEECERYFLVKGRKWRKTDPKIPDNLRQELSNYLMQARRDVGAAKRSEDERALASARRKVSDAKHALGERGQVWWESYSAKTLRKRGEAALFCLLKGRGSAKSVCPSEVARILDGEEWRALMPDMRQIAADLQQQGLIVVVQKGVEIWPPYQGPIRIRLADQKSGLEK